MDNEETIPPEHINQEEITQPMRRSTRHATPINRLEATTREKTYLTNNLIAQTLEKNEYTINYTKKRPQC